MILITARRAQTLKCPIYDEDFVRIELGQVSEINSIKAIADPSLDLKNPLKGPFNIRRDKPLKLENEALLLLKSAQLLPAAVISKVTKGKDYATLHNLTYLKKLQLEEMTLNSKDIADAIKEGTNIEAENTQFHIFRPNISGEEHYDRDR